MFPRWSFPTLPSIGLSNDERELIADLQSKALPDRRVMELSEAYYLGEQVIDNLRIAIPESLEHLRTIVGWASLAVDPYVERHSIDCFRLRSDTDANEYLSNLWSANGLDAELPLAITDALSMGQGYWCVGSPLEKGYEPRITVESPLNMAVRWDLRGIDPIAAFHQFYDNGRQQAALLRPGSTVHVALNDKSEWEVVSRDNHGFDFVPLVRMPNMARASNRAGRSAITGPLRSTIDSTCRTLLGLEVAREIYSAPGLMILGATEDAFVKSDGSMKTAWDAYITSVLALERDKEGNLPEVVQRKAYDPSVFTKIVDSAASQAASIVLAPPQDIGLYTNGNPVSAEAQNTAEARRNRRARFQQTSAFTTPLTKVMQHAVRFANKGNLPDEYRQIEIDWRDVEEVSPGVMSDSLGKQIAAGMIPATSDVTLKKAGWSAVQRARLAKDRKAEEGRQAARDIAASLIPPAAAQEPNADPAASI